MEGRHAGCTEFLFESIDGDFDCVDDASNDAALALLDAVDGAAIERHTKSRERRLETGEIFQHGIGTVRLDELLKVRLQIASVQELAERVPIREILFDSRARAWDRKTDTHRWGRRQQYHQPPDDDERQINTHHECESQTRMLPL